MNFRRAFALAATAAIGTIVISACGDDDTTADSSTTASGAGRVIEIAMTEMAYSPSTIDVKRGETVTFRFHNDGRAVHEAFIGNQDDQMQHGTSMSSPPMDSHGMGSDDLVTLEPGDTGELTYTFPEMGSMLIGCHQPGHYEAGMKATINVI
jgi:uncharacterized cupredoxin-like copper-binding protein